MASGGTPNGRDIKLPLKLSSFSEPRPKKRPAPRFDTSFDTELSLNTELRRSEDSAQLNHRSVPNNLGWSLGANVPERLAPTNGQRKPKPFEHVVLQEGLSSPDSPSRPSEFRRKKHHTPATIPRTRLPVGTPIAEREALERLRAQLNFTEDEVPTRGPSNSTVRDSPSRASGANNERTLRSMPSSLPAQDSNDTSLANAASSELEKVDTTQILERLKQVKDFLKQATSMFVTMNFEGNEEHRAKEYEQAAKLHRLIKHLQTQEKAYVDLLERTLAVEDDMTTENTPSVSVQTMSDDEKGETPSIREEELQGLRQQHALLQKMLEQQRQLKELQTRQAALLTLQRDAEQRLAQAEDEDDEGAVGGAGYDMASGRSRSGTEASQFSEATNELSTAADDEGLNPEQFVLEAFLRQNKEKQTALLRNEKDRDDLNERRPNKNHPPFNVDAETSADIQSVSDGQPDNEEAALALADAAQERLELENKLMALQAKKEQMDSLLKELQQLREAQLRKESIEARKPHVSSVNVAKKDNNEEKPLATTSQKLDDDSILEALEIHQKLQRLQDVRQHLQQLRDMIGQYQQEENGEASTGIPIEENSAPESGRDDEEEGAVGGVASEGQDNSNVDWILNYGFEDPEILTKLKQLQAARERVMNLKQTNQTVQLPVGTSRYHNETSNGHTSQSQTEESDTEATTTDTESNASSSVNGMAWQDDPEFQDKIKKLKSAKTKLKQLQELVKRVHQFPDSTPVLPTELAELSFDEGEDDEDDSSESEYDEEDDDEVEENQDSESLQDEQASSLPNETASDQEAEYQIRLQKQKNELARLLEERKRLMEMQQELSRLTQQQSNVKQEIPVVKTEPSEAVSSATAVQSRPVIRNSASPSLLRTDTFTVHKPSIPSRTMNDSSTQTSLFGNSSKATKNKVGRVLSVDSSEAARAAPTSSALVWSELRRQRELHEEKLKKRKHRLLNEKRKKAGLDDVSEGGTYSLRSADIDEGFGVSMMSADITTATWGGSTQPSSTQNDSAVSEDESANQEIPVEVEDDYPDGIVQAEEEEEQNAPDTYPRDVQDVFRSRERVPRTFPSGNIRPRKRVRGLKFAWPRIGSDRSPRRPKQQNFIPSEDLIEEREQEQFVQERQAWEQQCGQLHGEVAKLTDMCNNLLKDQQSLISALLGRANLPSVPQPNAVSSNPFSQYQQKEQNAYQSLHSYFDQQRYLIQHQQLLQTLNQCYSQLHQQQIDIGFLQGQFQQLFSSGGSPGVPSPTNRPTTNPFMAPNSVPAAFPSLHPYQNPPVSSMYPNPSSSNSFNFSPFQVGGSMETPAGFTPATLNQSDLQWPPNSQSKPSTVRAPSWVPVFTDPFKAQGTQTETNPETGVPSPRFTGTGTATNSQSLPSIVIPTSALVGNAVAKDYNPSVYAEASGAVVSSTKKPDKASDTVGRSFPTPLRAQAAANLAKKDRSSLKRGHESVETSSRTSSIPGDVQDKQANQDIDRVSETGSEFSLFEALRDSIYSEVATLISLNESRPHFLIELFRELQLLTSDYLRQRALYALRDIVTRFLTENSLAADIDKTLQQARFQAWAGSNSELTPSETVETSEDESRDDAETAQIVTEGIYDYAENVESGSTLSTPTSSHTGDPPFASEGLGETVIHFDQTLSKMREYERLREQGKLKMFTFKNDVKDDVTTSSAGDVGSDSSFSDVQYPRIDTQALDHQIKTIMSEVIPYLNEHMDDSCNADLLGYIRGLVLSRIQVRDEQEFGRFFHKQLASILQDSLSKFEEKKMKDCGEDMLVDMSEILFNELAFFKLMQDLDGSSGGNREPFWRQESQSGTDTGTGQEADKEYEEHNEKPEDSATEETESTTRENVQENIDKDDVSDTSDDSPSSSEDSEAEDEATGGDDEGGDQDDSTPITNEQKEAEEEALGKDRDDDMAARFEDMPESSKDSQSEYVKLELSVSESKPFTSAGSGEEDGEESYDDLQSKRTLEECEGGTAAGRDSTDSDGSDAPQDDQARTLHLQNGQEDHDEVAIDDLPTKLTGLTEADLQARIAEEQSRTQGPHAVLQHLAGGQELAGDANSLAAPGATVVNGTDEPEGEK